MNELRVLGKLYRIDRATNPSGLGGPQVFGTCDHARSIITMEQGQDDQQERDTLLHEAVHAIDYAMALGLKERQVHALSAGLVALFSDNPGLPFYLAGHAVEVVETPPPKKNATRTRR